MISMDLFVALFTLLLLIVTFIISKKIKDYTVLLITPIAIVVLTLFIFGHMNSHSEVQTKNEYKDKQIILSLSTSGPKPFSEKNFLSELKSESKSGYYNILSGNSKVGYEPKEIYGKEATVFLDEDKEPYIVKRIEKKHTMYKKTWLNGGLFYYDKQSGPFEVNEKYDIHLPSDSKKIEFKL